MTSTAMKPELIVADISRVAPDEETRRIHDKPTDDGQPPPRERADRAIGRPSTIRARIVRGICQLLLPIAVIAAGIGGYKYLKATKPEAPQRKARPAVYAVQTVPATFSDVRPELTLYGTTVAGRRVELRALVAGQVVATSDSLRDGGTIRQGDTVLSIDRFNYEADLAENRAQTAEATAKIAEFKASIATERGNLKFAKEQARFAETDLERAVPLSQRGAVTQRTVDERSLTLSQRRQAVTVIENNINVWQARIAQQEATLERLEAARQRAAQRLAETRLMAPFNAYITDVGAQVGRMVGVNDRVATLIDKDWIEVAFTVTDRQFGRLARGEGGINGREVDVRWNVGEKPIVYKARIDRVGASISSEAGGVQVYARVEKPAEGVGLRPGAFVELRVPDTQFADVVRLPSAAVFDGKTVYAVKDGKLQSRKVTIVSTSGADVLVRGEVKPGDQIMITRLSLPGDGVRVKVVAEPTRNAQAGAADVN